MSASPPKPGPPLQRLTEMPRLARIGLAWLAVCAAIFVAVLLALRFVAHMPSSHLTSLAWLMALTGAASLGVGLLALWLSDVAHVGGVRLRLSLPPLLTAVVVAINVVALSAMMRLNTADAQLVVGFVIFGVALALVVSLSVAREFSASLSLVEAAARQIADGDYSFRLDAQQVNGGPELASLARSFNRMADGVQQAFSERQRAEDERRQLMAALSHDVRTPVASLRAMIEAIDDGVVSDPETIARYQRTMRHEVRHLTDLLDQLFDLARLEAGTTALRRERVALSDLISDAIEATMPRANERGVRLTGDVAARLPTLEVDARQIHRVLSNLLDNALHHTPTGGVIAIRAEPAGDHIVRVRILDSGEGIAAGDLPHVFQAAYRGEPSRSRSTGAGAGLGLAIARQIIVAHGGEIHAHSPLDDAARALLAGDAPSQAGPGTEISFTLPVS